MKNPTILLVTLGLFFFSICSAHAQSQADTAKVKPKYEYAILTFRLRNAFSSTLDINYENGKHEKFPKDNSSFPFTGGLYEHYDILFKAFEYLGEMRYELESSTGTFATWDGIQYIFRRERK